jgi:hypothetical protein
MAIIIKCIRSTGDREAPSINDALIVTENDAVKRGKRWLDDNYYLVKKRTLKVPHKMTVNPGDWITVSDSNLGLNATKLKVISQSITITPSSVWAAMETAQYAEFDIS